MKITKIDFNGIGQIAIHCDLPKLEIAINESELFDLRGLFCGDWDSILEVMQEVDDYLKCLEEQDPEEPIECIVPENYELKYQLIYGGSFDMCSGTGYQVGVKKIWAYYAYARYIILNSFNDTPNGLVSKTNDFSLPKPLKEIELMADKYRSMGYESFKMLNDFLCQNKDIFDYSFVNCKSCGCKKCKPSTNVKGYGFLGGNITKRV